MIKRNADCDWNERLLIDRKSALARSNFFGAIFDWDGVIIDSAKLHEQSWHRLAHELGTEIAPGSFVRGFGMKSAQIIEQIHRWATAPEEIARLTNRKEALYREIVGRSEIAPLPGVVGMVAAAARSEVPCAVASSTQRANIEAVLERIGLQERFPRLFPPKTSCMANQIRRFSRKPPCVSGSKRRRCVVFEDAHVGIEAAHAAGMKVVAVTTTHPASQLSAADLIVSDWMS